MFTKEPLATEATLAALIGRSKASNAGRSSDAACTCGDAGDRDASTYKRIAILLDQ